MRTIKFRAWCNHEKKFHYRVCVGNTSTDDPCSIVWVSDEVGWVNFDKLSGVIQQFTGLLDKNGKEIYEGDIVEDPYLGNFIVEYVNDSEGSHFILSPENNEDQGYILPIDNDYTVVGNIFEK